MFIDQRFDAEHFTQQRGGQHLFWRAAGDDASVVDHVQPIAEGRGQVEVVDARQGADLQALDQLQQFELIAWIEVVGRFVEDQQLRLLSQGAGEYDALFFAARQRGEGVIFEAFEAHRFQCLFSNSTVFQRIAIKQAFVWCAAHGDHFLDGQAEGIGELLQYHRNALRTPARRLLPDVVMGQMHLTGFRFAEPVGTAQQAGLAAAVGPDQADELTGRHVQAGLTQLELVMTVAMAQRCPGEMSEVQRGHCMLVRRVFAAGRHCKVNRAAIGISLSSG